MGTLRERVFHGTLGFKEFVFDEFSEVWISFGFAFTFAAFPIGGGWFEVSFAISLEVLCVKSRFSKFGEPRAGGPFLKMLIDGTFYTMILCLDMLNQFNGFFPQRGMGWRQINVAVPTNGIHERTSATKRHDPGPAHEGPTGPLATLAGPPVSERERELNRGAGGKEYEKMTELGERP